MISKAKKGHTLVEVMIAAFLAMFLIIVLSNLAILTKRYWQGSEGKIDAIQNAQIGLERILRDMEDSDVYSLTVISNSKVSAVSFLSAFGDKGEFQTDKDGKPEWQKQVIYYLRKSDKSLRRRELRGNFSEPLQKSKLLGECRGGKTVAFNVERLDVTKDEKDRSARIELSTSLINANGELYKSSLSATAFIYNSKEDEDKDDNDGGWDDQWDDDEDERDDRDKKGRGYEKRGGKR